jgi:hypothetical protein
MKLICCYCKKEFTVKESNRGSRLRSIRLGLSIYCGRTCFGIASRTNETPEEKKVYKQWYDLFIRESMEEDERILKSLQSLVLFHLDYRANPDKYKAERKRRMADHIEYCRQPEYKEYKKGYDEQYRAKKHFGDYWEAAIALKNLDKEIDYRESKRQNKIYNKSTTKRKRAWQKQLKQNLKNLQQLI